jgi:hypothetical protein
MLQSRETLYKYIWRREKYILVSWRELCDFENKTGDMCQKLKGIVRPFEFGGVTSLI